MRVCVYASESNALHLVLEQKNKKDFLYFVSCKLPTPLYPPPPPPPPPRIFLIVRCDHVDDDGSQATHNTIILHGNHKYRKATWL